MKRKVLAAVLAISAVISLSACGGQTASTSSSSSAVSAVSAVSAEESSETAGSTSASASAAETSTETAAAANSTSASESDLLRPEADENAQKAGSREENVSNSMIGSYTYNGYENEEFNFKIVLPSSYTLESRAAFVLAGEDAVESSNDSDAYDWVRTNLSLGSATLFSAGNGTTAINVYLEGLNYFSNRWEDEKTVAENTVKEYQSRIEEAVRKNIGEDATVTDFDATTTEVEVGGEEHYAGLLKCKINGVDYIEYQIFLPADDKEHYMTIDVGGFDLDEAVDAMDYFEYLN